MSVSDYCLKQMFNFVKRLKEIVFTNSNICFKLMLEVLRMTLKKGGSKDEKIIDYRNDPGSASDAFDGLFAIRTDGNNTSSSRTNSCPRGGFRNGTGWCA